MDLRSGYPFSLIKSGLVTDYPKLENDIRTEVVIMGGGISGALTAFCLVMNNVPCVVIDGRSIGLGSTCASTSLLQYEIDTPLFRLKEMVGEANATRAYWLCYEAIDKLAQIAKVVGFPEFKKKKSLYYAAAKKDIAFLKQEFKARKEAGFAVQYLKEEEMTAVAGIQAPAAILSDQAAETNAYLFTHYLHLFGIKKGLQVFDRSPVTAIHHHARSVELQTANGKKIRAKKLIYATGYEAVQYIDKPIVKLLSTYAVASEPLSQALPFWKNDMLLWNTARPYLYMRTTPDRRILVGGRDEDFYSPGKRDKLLKVKAKALTKDFQKIFPSLPFIPEFSWTGTFGSTRDGLPFIGKYKKLINSYFALGFGGNGITFSLIAAEMIAAEICGNRTKDTQLFSFNRM